MIAKIAPTGEKVPFNEISIGKLFFCHDRFWVRTSNTAGTDIGSDKGSYGTCTFFITDDMIDDEGQDQQTGWMSVEKVEVTFT